MAAPDGRPDSAAAGEHEPPGAPARATRQKPPAPGAPLPGGPPRGAPSHGAPPPGAVVRLGLRNTAGGNQALAVTHPAAAAPIAAAAVPVAYPEPGNAAPAGAAGGDAAPAAAAHRLWGGRSSAAPAASLDELNRSLPIDQRLWREDIAGSRAWLQALQRAGVLDVGECRTLDEGLIAVAARLEREGVGDAGDEDIHTLVERLLYEEVGAAAGRLHTGRSRNDQVATDARLWALGALARVDAELVALERALAGRAEEMLDVLMPSYTHLRRAQPVRAAHWLLAHFWAFDRDRQRLAGALERVAVLPLGAGAIAGSGFPVDRTLLKELLGFRGVAPNSLDAVGERDWICEVAFVASLIGVHLSRLAEDLIVFSSEEFGFVSLPDAYTTGSSLMPQKRNPDGLELARGMAARLIGDLTASLTLLKGLPSGYNKDVQEDKRLLFSAVDTLLTVLPVTRETVAALEFHAAVLNGAAEDEALLATDLADALVRRGVPFREAHGAVGALLRAADAAGSTVQALPDEAWGAAHPAFLAGGRPAFSAEASVEARSAEGGTARVAIERQLAAAWAALD